MNAELKPCPFCRGEARRSVGGEAPKQWFGTGCSSYRCPAQLHALVHHSAAEADAAWNTRASPPQQTEVGWCEWRLDDEDAGTWRSSCGELWSFIDGGPAENRVSFCHHCGKPVDVTTSPKEQEHGN